MTTVAARTEAVVRSIVASIVEVFIVEFYGLMVILSEAVIAGSLTLVTVSCKIMYSYGGNVTVGLRAVGFDIEAPAGPSTMDHKILTAPPEGSEADPAKTAEVASGSSD